MSRLEGATVGNTYTAVVKMGQLGLRIGDTVLAMDGSRTMVPARILATGFRTVLVCDDLDREWLLYVPYELELL